MKRARSALPLSASSAVASNLSRLTLCGVGLALVLAGPGPGCVGDVAAPQPLSLRDPLGLIDDVYASGNQLRLYVLPADAYGCDPTTGIVTPDPADLPPGGIDNAIADLELSAGEMRGRELTVQAGAFVVFVRGKGDDTATGRMDVVIARGCASTDVGVGETRAVTVMLAPVTVTGMCGDGVLSPDEQCEPPGAGQCDASCRTTEETLPTATDVPMYGRTRLATRPGRNSLAVWDTSGMALGVSLRLMSESGQPLTGMGPLEIDASLEMATMMALPANQSAGSPAVAPDGSHAIAFQDFPDMGNVRVAFFNAGRGPLGIAEVRMTRPGPQTAPSGAYDGGGAYMVAFVDADSSSGIGGRVFAAGSTTPSGAEAFSIGTSGGTGVAVAGLSSGFAVAFAEGGQVFHQRFGADGSAMGTPAEVAPAGGARDQVAIAALDDGTTLVAWREANLDGAGSGIGARVFSAAGAPVGERIIINTTTAGDQSAPAAAAASGRFFVAWESGGSIRGRSVDATASAVLNHEPMPSFGDFAIGSGSGVGAASITGGTGRLWWVSWSVGTTVRARRFPL